mgnify:CR=1 FL=1
MSDTRASAESATWSIAAAARATNLTQHTLRAWERRFGFPSPARLPSGHRRLTAEQVEHLKLIKRARDLGHRASAVVPLPVERLLTMLPLAEGDQHSATQWCAATIELLRMFDLAAVADRLRGAAATLGVSVFLRERLHPLLVAVGERRAKSELDVRHEHLLSELVEDELRASRQRLEPATAGRPMVLATLAGENHALPLHIVALAAIAGGRRILLLGPDTPTDEIVHTAGATNAEVVGVTVSTCTCSPATVVTLNRLRTSLAPRSALWIGGSGLAGLSGLHPAIVRIGDLRELEQQLARLPGAVLAGGSSRRRETHGAARRP